MKYKLERTGIRIIPETEQDVAYIEDTLRLKSHGDYLQLVRKDLMGIVECLQAESRKEETDG